MDEQSTIPGTDDPRFDHERMRKFEVDLTPRPVVEQACAWLKEQFFAYPPLTGLDPAAGPGVFGDVVRATWPRCRVDSIEPRAEETAGLKAKCRPGERVYADDLVTFADWRAARGRSGPYYGLIIGNPPFSLAQLFVETLRPMLTEGGRLVLLLPTRWANRGEDRAAWLHTRETVICLCGVAPGCPLCGGDSDIWQWPNLPEFELPIAGSLQFRSGINPRNGKPYAADVRDYSWHGWTKGPRVSPVGELPTVKTQYLPWLPADQRQWTIRPGTE